MPSSSNIPEASSSAQKDNRVQKQRVSAQLFHLPRNIYLLLFFTLGKGFQLSIAALTLNYYVHSLGYQPDFIGVFSAAPALGALLAAFPTGLFADRFGRKPVLIASAILSPLFLAVIGLVTSAPLLLAFSLLQGMFSTAYWVTNLPLLTESSTEEQRVGVLALNSFLLLGVGALGDLLGGAIPQLVGGMLHVSAASSEPLRWGVIIAALFTFIFGLPLWFLREPRRESIHSLRHKDQPQVAQQAAAPIKQNSFYERATLLLFVQLLIPDLLFTMGEGAVVALIQIYFVLRFQLLPGPLGLIFTFSGVLGGLFSLTAPLFVRRWKKLRIITAVQYISAPLMVLIGLAPTLPLAIVGEYTRSSLRILIDPMYAAFAMEKVSDRQRATLAGLYSTTWSIGFSIGPTIAGWLQTNVSLSASFIFGGFCLVLAPSLLLLFFGRERSDT